MRQLPPLASLWSNYPNGEADQVKQLIGGNVNASWITNTCAIRISRALNAAAAPVPSGFPGLTVVRGGDGKWYGFRVAEMRKYLENNYGKPVVSAPGGAEGRAAVAGKKGIICFVVTTWSDASGHLDLWDGTSCCHAEYFDLSKNVYLWACP